MKVFGLTGGIATGKSAVSSILRDRGVYVADADHAARTTTGRGSPVTLAIRAAFGGSVVTPEGELDRKALAQIVFRDAEARKRLEAITHPAIRAHVMDEIAHNVPTDGFGIVDAALMIESGWAAQFAAVIVVWCPPEVQLDRLMMRDKLSREDALARISAQMPIDEKRKRADYVIDNSGSLAQLPLLVDRALDWVRGRI